MQDDTNFIIALHKKYAPSIKVFNLVFTHCQIVCQIALQLAEKKQLHVDRALVQTGALLHDIGVYPLFSQNGKLRDGVHYITHGTLGEEILINEGYPEKVWRFAAHHTGVGLTKQDVIDQKLPLQHKDYTAASTEELLIMYADKFHSKTTPPYFNSYEWYLKDISRFGMDKMTQFERMSGIFGIPDLEQLAAKYYYDIR